MQVLLELSRSGSMREVADVLGTTTSGVSQQIAALAREVGTALVEPEGRRVRLTPAGRRLAAHAQTVLAAVEAARLDLDPTAEPAGTVRTAGFSSAVRRAVLPLVHELAQTHPGVRLVIREHEPPESLALLAADEIDLALGYDYDLAPLALPPGIVATPLWTVRWGLGVPAADVTEGTAAEVFARFADADWIVNSRNRADEDVVRLLASTAGFTPRLAHQVDSLDLVADLVLAGLGVGLLPAWFPERDGVRVLPLRDPAVTFRTCALTRRGAAGWAPLALVVDLLTRSSAGEVRWTHPVPAS